MDRFLYFFILFFALLFIGCSSKDIEPKKELEKEQEKEHEKSTGIYDLENIPQDITIFTKNLDEDVNFYDIQKKYEKYYFRVWNLDRPSETLEAVKWSFRSYRVDNSYGENLQPLKKDFFDKMYENANFSEYATVNRKAITLKHLNIRAFPTLRPLLKDPSLAGEGFPFDYLQNSSISANKPIFVSHFSKDREWVYIFSSFASGWVESSDIVFLQNRDIETWQKAEQILLTKENIPLYSIDGEFLFSSKIGMMLALIEEKKDEYIVLGISKYKNSEPLYVKVKVSKNIAHKNILTINRDNLNTVINEVSLSNYGWGGMYGQRDCSSTIRDIFAPFGIWLPRNSSQQAKIGKIISLKDLSDEEKIKLIKDKAIAFETLLYKRGHILLYVGIYNDEIVVLHNTWGIKVEKDEISGRIIIGKTILSSLKLGKNQKNYDEKSELLKNLTSMNILTN
ncbi:MAG: SH3 domain-containing protein [Sulfurimonas sp.]|nr:SH3 domain-containing protein [Sulfurimonas sp.]